MRYIDADEVKKAIEESWDGCLGAYDSHEITMNDLWIIDKVPTADVVEVVRCKDCKFYNEAERMCNDTNGFDRYWKPTDFCSNGERRE